MNNGLIVSVSPHYHKQGATTQRVMLDVLIALIPALIASVVIFGFRSLLLVAVSAANCVLLEFVWNKLFKKEQTIADLSAVVTGVLIPWFHYIAVLVPFLAPQPIMMIRRAVRSARARRDDTEKKGESGWKSIFTVHQYTLRSRSSAASPSRRAWSAHGV